MNEAQPRSAEDKSRAIFLCASLAGETERQRSFSKNFSDETMFRFVDSVDGRGWSDAEADAHVSHEMKLLRERERLKGKLWLNPAAIACALTHRDMLLSVAEEADVVLCEDDVLLRRDFIELWSNADVRSQFSMLDSVVLLHYSSRSPITTSAPPVAEFGNYKIFKLDEVQILSGACYYPPPPVARRIRHFQMPIRSSADAWLEMRNSGVIPCVYVVHPSPCSIAGMASNIGYGSAWRSNAIWMIFMRRLKRLIQRNRQQLYETLVVRR